MSNDPSTAGRGAKTKLARRRWAVDAGDPATVLAGARRAFFVMTGVLALLWALQIANAADSYNLTASYGITPRDVGSLPDILTAPFLHRATRLLFGVNPAMRPGSAAFELAPVEPGGAPPHRCTW